MIRRLLFVGAVALAVISISKARRDRTVAKMKERNAEASWESEGGTPAPEPAAEPA